MSVFSPDGKNVVVAGCSLIEQWDLSRTKPIRRYRVQNSVCTALIYGSSGRDLFFGTDSGDIYRLDLNKMRAAVIYRNMQRIEALQMANGNILCAGKEGSVAVLNVTTGVPTLVDHVGKKPRLQISRDGGTFYVADGNGNVFRFDRISGKKLLYRAERSAIDITPIALTGDERQLAVGEFGHVSLVNVDDGSVINSIELEHVRRGP